MKARLCFSRTGKCAVAATSFLLLGCAPMSTKEELQSLGADEGIFFGSILLVPQKEAAESDWAFLKGRKGDGVDYWVQVEISRPRRFTDILPTQAVLGFTATPGKEAYFVKKVPAGKYSIASMIPNGLFVPKDAYWRLGLVFEVRPKTATYVGKVVVALPQRLGSGCGFGFAVQDAQQEVTAGLGDEFAAILPIAVKGLAERDGPLRVVECASSDRKIEALGRVADGKYYSARGWFSVPMPRSSNWAQAPFSVQDKSVASPEANYEIVVFSVKDFGEVLIAGVDHVSDDFIAKNVKPNGHRTVLSNLSTMALHFNTDVSGVSARQFPVRPSVVEEGYLDTSHGEALFRVYRAEKGSLLARATGRVPTSADTFDTLIAVVVALNKNQFVYAVAENDAEGNGSDGNKEALKQRVQAFFASMSVNP